MIEDYFRKGINYEILICRAFNCEKGLKHGANSELFIELIKFELEDSKCIKYKRRLQKLKKYLAGALFKLRKRKRYLESDGEFSPILFKLNNAKNADDLAIITNLSLAKIMECENRLKESG